MGRRFREKRRKSLSTHFQTRNLSNDPKAIQLLKWLHRHGYRESKSLRLSGFLNTGRGLMAREHIPADSVIISIPLRLLVTRNHALEQLPSLRGHSCSTQEVLSAFLLREVSRVDSPWSTYLATLPTSYSVPFFCEDGVVDVLPEYLRQKIWRQKKVVNDAFSKMCHLLNEDFNRDHFAWAWYTVNTRAVYLAGSAPDVSDCLALAPLLDMFNHSSDAAVTVGLNARGDAYEIITQKEVEKHSETFINYGPHDNLKLCLEYGFMIPGGKNSHDSVPITVEELVIGDSSKGSKNKRLKIIAENGLGDKMSVHKTGGISWNILANLWILNHLKESQVKDNWHSVFQIDLKEEGFKVTLVAILTEKLKEIRRSLAAISDNIGMHSCQALDVVQGLLVEHESILDSNVNLLSGKDRNDFVP